MKILYNILGELGNLSAGSGLRPNSMYHAFLKRGHTVYVLCGYQGREQGKDRQAEVDKAIAWVEENNPDLCYIESSTYPMIHSCDYEFIRYLHKKKIPTAYFYRDFYRNFPDLFPRRKGFANAVKEMYLDIMQWRTDRILQLVDIVYFPSKQCFSLFHYRNMKALPPAGEKLFLSEHENTKTCIYVGGVSDFYGFPLMLEAFQLLNREQMRYRLVLVCREAEFLNVWKDREIPAWLEVRHASGQELVPLYARADLGLLALQKNQYADLAVGTKLFQYLSYGLPVLSTDVDAMHEIICEGGFGCTAPHDAHGFAQAIREVLDDSDLLRSYRNNIYKNLSEKNLWVHRVDQIVDDLMGEDSYGA